MFVARKIPVAGLQRLQAAAEITVWPGAMAPPPEALLAQLAGCTGLLSLFTDRVDGALLDAVGPQLRVSEGFNTWDERAALHSAVRLSALEPAVMCMGHGPVLRAAAPAMQRVIAAHKRRLQIS